MSTVQDVCLRICILFPAGIVTSGMGGWRLLQRWWCLLHHGAVPVIFHPHEDNSNWIRLGLTLSD